MFGISATLEKVVWERRAQAEGWDLGVTRKVRAWDPRPRAWSGLAWRACWLTSPGGPAMPSGSSATRTAESASVSPAARPCPQLPRSTRTPAPDHPLGDVAAPSHLSSALVKS